VLEHFSGKPVALRAEDERHVAVQLQLVKRSSAARHERDPFPLGLVERVQMHAEDRPHRRADRLGPGWIRAAFGQRNASGECVGRPQQRSDVPRVSDVPERERDGTRSVWEIVAPKDGDDPWWMRERRHLCEQLGRDVLARDKHVRRLNPGDQTSLEQILPLDRKQPELVPPAPLVELADELEPLVVAGGDQTV